MCVCVYFPPENPGTITDSWRFSLEITGFGLSLRREVNFSTPSWTVLAHRVFPIDLGVGSSLQVRNAVSALERCYTLTFET